MILLSFSYSRNISRTIIPLSDILGQSYFLKRWYLLLLCSFLLDKLLGPNWNVTSFEKASPNDSLIVQDPGQYIDERVNSMYWIKWSGVSNSLLSIDGKRLLQTISLCHMEHIYFLPNQSLLCGYDIYSTQIQIILMFFDEFSPREIHTTTFPASCPTWFYDITFDFNVNPHNFIQICSTLRSFIS